MSRTKVKWNYGENKTQKYWDAKTERIISVYSVINGSLISGWE